jgi:hypothetical protein
LFPRLIAKSCPRICPALAVLGFGVLAGWMLARLGPGLGPAPATIRHQHAGPTLENIRELSELVTLTVDVSDVQQTRIGGRVGGITALLAVKGDAQVSVDLSAARFERIDRRARTAVLVLPDPVATRPRLDHDHSRLFAIREDGLWAITPGDRMYSLVTDRAWAEAQHTVAVIAADPKVVERASRHAELVLRAHFAALGWDVAVRWPGRP